MDNANWLQTDDTPEHKAVRPTIVLVPMTSSVVKE